MWLTLQTEAAKAHPRWPELCVRVLNAAISQGAPASEMHAWYRIIADRVRDTTRVPRLTFRKLAMESQMLLADDVALTEAEVADVEGALMHGAPGSQGDAEQRVPVGEDVAKNAEGDVLQSTADDTRSAALATALERKKRRHAAACILQARLPVYTKRFHECQERDAALRRAHAWLSCACAALAECGGKPLAVLQLHARAVVLAARTRSWRVMLNAVAGFWDALRMHVTSPADLPEVASAVWEKRAAEDEPLWRCTAAELSLARVIGLVLHSVLQCASALQSKASLLDEYDWDEREGAEPWRARGGIVPLDGVTITSRSEASFSLGSDAPAHEWFAGISELDLQGLNSLFLGGFAALAAQHRNATILSIGRAWSEVTCGAFDRSLMPHLIAAAQKLSVESQPLQRALAAAEQSATDAVSRLWAVRQAVQKAFGVGTPLATIPRASRAARHSRTGSSWSASQSMQKSTRSVSPKSVQAHLQVGFSDAKVAIARTWP
jgi:hypothetical protein